jgi:alpha-methylacyl-CoA racemase
MLPMKDQGPLKGLLVLDVTRMVPGGIASRMLLDFGARVIKVEEPGTGDPFRASPPLVGGVGAGFAALYRGAESLSLDLRDDKGAADLRKLAKHSDVLLESFRPGTFDKWGLGAERLSRLNPRLIVCALSGYGAQGAHAARVGHDMNFTAESGLLSLLRGDKLPLVPFSDIAGGLLAVTAVLAALAERARTGRGRFIDQPLAIAALPFLTWNMADASAGGGGLAGHLLSGNLPSYRLYACSDGRKVALCALEPKFWSAFLAMVGIPDHSDAGLDPGAAGQHAAERIREVLATRPSAHWLHLAREKNLPLSPVNDLAAAAADPDSPHASYFERTPSPGGGGFLTPGPFVPSLGETPASCAPGLGEHDDAIRKEFGLD